MIRNVDTNNYNMVDLIIGSLWLNIQALFCQKKKSRVIEVVVFVNEELLLLLTYMTKQQQKQTNFVQHKYQYVYFY